MSKIDLEDDGVFAVEVSRETAREYFDQPDSELTTIIEGLVDEAQGYAGTYNKPAFIVIEVKP
jgi:hypothetical protein